MSKQKNKKNKAATPKEPITRRDLCERIHVLQQEVDTLRRINSNLTNSAFSYKNESERSLKLAEKSIDKLERMTKHVRHYRTMNKLLIIALILSGIAHLIDIFL